jgi:polysaccharide biosynthesis protein PslH
MLWLQRQIARRYEQFMFTPYPRTVVLSEQDRDELLSINPALKVEVIPNGIDTYEFRFPKVQRKLDALLFVGNYEYAPNVDAALTLARYILPEVQKCLPELKLWLVGNNPPPELQALASESIKVTGRVPDVRPYFARAKAFVCPLRMGAGIKNKVLEALALGCPVIATPLSVDGIDARDGQEFLISDIEAMAGNIVRLFEDADLQRTLANNGRKLIESRYRWDHVAEKYLDLYRTIL